MPPDVLERLADAYRADLLALADDTGRVAEEEFDRDADTAVAVVAGAVATANRRAVTRSLRFLADALTVRIGGPAVVDPLDPRPFGDLEVIRRHLATIVRSAPGDDHALSTVRMRGARLARAEPVGAAQRAQRAAMSRDQRVTGGERHTSARPCPLCTDRAGEWVPLGADIRIHPHCSCVAIPAI